MTSASEEQKEGVSIDGSYRGQDEENTILLVVTGRKGTFTVTKMLMEKKRAKGVSIDRSINPCVSGMSLIAIGSGDQLSLEDLEQAEG